MKNKNNQLRNNYWQNRRIAVTGMGVFAPDCPDRKAFRSHLFEGESVLYCQNIEDKRIIGAFLSEEDLADGFQKKLKFEFPAAKKVFQRASKSVKASLLAVSEAWQCAGFPEMEINAMRIGIVVAGSNISNQTIYQAMKNYQSHMELLHPRYALDFLDTCQIGAISEMLPVQGESMTVGGASASGNVALLQAAHLIQLHILDVCIVVGAMADLSLAELNGFINLGAYGGKSFLDFPEGASRPFDCKHEGFVLGQAAACLILEGEDTAKERNAEIMAYLLGGAQMLDRTSLSEPNTENQAIVMQEALDRAGIYPDEIAYVNAHGTSTPIGDISELTAIKKVFKEHTEELWLNSTKALFGHCLYSAGVLEAAACVIQMQEKFVHGMPHLVSPVAEGFRFAKGKAPQENQVLRYALSNSYGFTGINTTIILGREIKK